MRFELALENPRAGWIDVAIAIGDDSCAFMASHVLNDPLRELAELALLVASGDRGSAGVMFWCEPGGYELRVWDRTLAWLSSEDVISRTPRELRFEQAIEAPRAIAAEILRALREIGRQLPAQGDPAIWDHPFPADLVARLAGMLAA